MTSPVPAPDAFADTHGARLLIDLDALAANWRLLRDRAAPAECGAVVKADAYGIGLDRAAPALWKAGARTFFVAHLAEGAGLRAVLPDAVLYVMNGMPPGTAAGFDAIDARPVLGSPDEIAEWARYCASAGRRLPAALHVDTGMNRLGLPPGSIDAIAASPHLDAFAPTLLMSHFVVAEEPDRPENARQIEAFRLWREALPDIPGSLANSSGHFLPDLPRHDLTRPGYALYGGNPTPQADNPMSPVVRLEARILQIREVAAGETVGYGAAWTAARPSRLATISLGYADGFPRSAGATDAERLAAGSAIVGGVLCPFAGKVSMDLVVVDVTEAPEAAARRGELATLIGDALPIDEVGRRAGTIGYEILTGLGARYPRSYRGG